jgi:hypothetical protein
VAEPRIGYEASAGAVLEVSWTLQGCRGDGWAPVAIRAEQLPADLRWTPVQILTDLELEATGGWDHPLEHLLRAPDWEGPAATGHRVLAHEVPGLVPTPIEILYSHTRVEAPADETVSPDPCQVSSSTREIHGLWTGAGVETFEVAPDATATPMLRGAISQGDRPEALLYREGLGGWILVPPSVAAEANDAEPDGTDPGPAQWTEIPINVGVFTAQSWAAADYRVTVPGC